MERPTDILGISCFYHDSAAAILKDGKVIAAAQEERFTRIKHDKAFPGNAINYCLEAAEIDITRVTLEISRSIVCSHKDFAVGGDGIAIAL